MGETFLDRHGIKSRIKLNDVIEEFKYVYKGQEVKAGDLVNYINGIAGKVDYGESVDTQLSTETYTAYLISAIALDENRVFIAHRYGSNSYLYGIVCEIDGATIITGADTVLSTLENAGQSISTVLLEKNKVFIAYSPYYNLYGMIVSVDGTTITKGTETALVSSTSGTGAGKAISAVLLNNGNVFIAHSYHSTYNYLYGIVCTISGTTITAGSDTVLNNTKNTSMVISTCILPNGNVFIAHSYGSGYYLYGMVVSIDGTTITAGSDTAIVSSKYAGTTISAATLEDNKVFIAHSHTSNTSGFLYGIVCIISGTTVSTGTDTELCREIYAGATITTIVLDENRVFIVHRYGASYYLYGVICKINGTTIVTGVETALISASYSGYAISSLLLDNGTIVVAHSMDSSNYYLFAQLFSIDDNNIPTNNIVITEYEQQVTPAIEPPFNAIALSSGVGAPEFVEVTKTDNIIPTSDWVVASNNRSMTHSEGYSVSVDYSAANSPIYMFDNNVKTKFSIGETRTSNVDLTLPKPIKITKMKTYITWGNDSDTYWGSVKIQGSKGNEEWIDLYEITTMQTELTEITLSNTDYYTYYRIANMHNHSGYESYIYEWQVSEYIAQIPSTEHKDQVKIARVPNKLSMLPVGSLVKDTNSTFLGEPVIWKIADKNHEGYPDNSVTLITERCIALRAFDAKEPKNSDSNRKSYGNNRYSVSNIRQWLNSNTSAGNWYSAQHEADQAPSTNYVSYNAYSDDSGFLNGFSETFRNALLNTNLTVALNTVTDGGGSETLTDKIFLASNTEVGATNANNIAEGALLSMFSDNASRIAYVTSEGIADSEFTTNLTNDTTAWTWHLRTPYVSNTNYPYCVNGNGGWDSFAASVGIHGIRPLCNIPSSTIVSDTPDTDGCYTLFAGGEA